MSLTGDSIPGWTPPPQPGIIVNPVVLQALSDSSNVAGMIAQEFEGRLVTTFISTALFGVFASFIVVSAFVLVPRCRSNRFCVIFMLAMIAMFTSTTVYWVFALRNILGDAAAIVANSKNVSADIQCLQLGDGVPPQQCASLAQEYLDGREPPFPPSDAHKLLLQRCVGTVALTVNVTLGDAIVWWRACVLWPNNKLIGFTCVLFILATFATGSVSTAHACDMNLNSVAISAVSRWSDSGTLMRLGSLYEGDNFGIAATALSFASNFCVTFLIAYKAWTHRILVRGHLNSLSGRSQVGSALALLVESGIVYSIIWLFVVVYQILVKPSLEGGSVPTPNNAMTFLSGSEMFMEGALVTIIAIYPTLVVILVALNRSRSETIFAVPGSDGAPPAQSIVFHAATWTGTTLESHTDALRSRSSSLILPTAGLEKLEDPEMAQRRPKLFGPADEKCTGP